MKRVLSLLLMLTLVVSVFLPYTAFAACVVDPAEFASVEREGNLLPEKSGTFENAASVGQTGWVSKYGPLEELTLDASVVVEGGQSLRFKKAAGSGATYYTASLDIAPYMTEAGMYLISFAYRTDLTTKTVPFNGIIRTNGAYSFNTVTSETGNYSDISAAPAVEAGAWGYFARRITVTQEDIDQENRVWDLCVHQINDNVTTVWLDNICVARCFDEEVPTLKDEIGFTDPYSQSGLSLSANLIPAKSSSFESGNDVWGVGWELGYGVITEFALDRNNPYAGSQSLYFGKNAGSANSYHSISLNVAPYITKAGTYRISFAYRTNATTNIQPFSVALRCGKQYSFTGTNTYGSFVKAGAVQPGEWGTYAANLYVSQEDINSRGADRWNLCLHVINENVTQIWLDEVKLQRYEYDKLASKADLTGYTWVANEVVLVSSKSYADPFYDVDVDMILTNGEQTLTIPGFWDGDNLWRIRFACPTAGTWTYRTVCTDTTDSGLHNKKGTITVAPYTGKIAMYQNGFVKTEPGVKYFIYQNGQPFFYLGDTHWSLGTETLDMVEVITEQRVKQGFTVIQSEPLGARFKVEDGKITTEDVIGFQEFDQKFFEIANKGLLHTNAEFFYPSAMQTMIENLGGFSEISMGNGTHSTGTFTYYDLTDKAKAGLERMTRYWVARYSAFPVMWTLGQEIDNDFFWDRANYNGHDKWSYVNNPYRLVAQYIGKYDPYRHPLSGHQEGASTCNAATGSAFRDVENHTWWASQWSQGYNSAINMTYPKDYWNNGQGKPAVIYEGRYCYLWTKNFGARVQGYMAYLNGMFGYGWGGQDTWSYLNTYDEANTSSDGVDTIRPEEKQAATWQDSLQYSSTYQMGWMRDFFENTVGNWYDLVPRFDSTTYFSKTSSKVFYIHASTNDKTKAVTYFYQSSDKSLMEKPNATDSNAVLTGTVNSLLPNTRYAYLWFNPSTGIITEKGTFTANSSGKWTVGNKAKGDMVLYVYREEAAEVQITPPATVAFELGQPVNLSGLAVSLKLNSGKVQALGDGEYEISGLTTDRLGAVTLTVTGKYNGTVASNTLNVYFYKVGDTDYSGTVTAEDVTALARGLAYICALDPGQTAAADMNTDGTVTAADLTALARRVSQIKY